MGGISGIIFGPYALDINRFIAFRKGEECVARRADLKRLKSLILLSRTGPRAVYAHEIPELEHWCQHAEKQAKNLRQSVFRLRRDLGKELADYLVAASKCDPSKKGAYMFIGNARFVADLRSEYPYPLRMSLPPIVKHSTRRMIVLSDKERKVVREVAESLNMEEVALARQVSESMTQQKYLELLNFKKNQSAMRQKRLQNQLLGLYYDKELPKHNLHRYSVRVGDKIISSNIAVCRDWLNLQVDLEDQQDRFKVVHPCSQAPSLKLEEVADLVASSFLLGVRISNEPVFCLEDIKPTQSKSPISFSIGQYFEHRLGHGKLRTDLVHALIDSKLDPEKAIFHERLGPRKDLLDAGSIKNFSGRRCIGGVNVVVAFQRHNDFVFFAEQRSDEVASACGELCTIPNGVHQSLTKRKVEQQVSIRESAFRELWEELFNGEQVIQYDGHNEPDWYYRYPQLHWFTEKNNRKNFEHLWVCFGADLTDGSYQFGLLLIVRSPQYLERYKDSIWPNYEFRHKGELPLEISTKKPYDLAALLTNDLCADTSIFTIVEAIRALKDLDKKGRVVLPDIELVTAA